MTITTASETARLRERFAGCGRWCAVLLVLYPAVLSRPARGEIHGGYQVTPSDPPGGISPFSIVGWAVSPCGKPDLRILLDGKPYAVLVPIYRLSEIRDRFPGLPGSDSAGFWVSIDPAGLPSGPHTFEIRAVEASCGEVKLGEIRFVARAPTPAAAAGPALAMLLFVVPFFLARWLAREQDGRAPRIPLLPVSALVLAALASTIVLAGRFGETVVAGKPGVFSPLGNWDGEEYLQIALHGYGGPGSHQEWGWFPLFPALLRLLTLIPLPLALLGSLFNFSCALGAVVLLRDLYPGRTEGVLFYILFPSSIFFVACYSEASFVLLLTGALAAVKRGKPFPAALFGALAALTRPSGFLVGLFALEFLRARRWRDFAITALGPVAGLGFWYALPSRWTGDAGKYFEIQHGLGRNLAFHPGRLLDVLLTPIAHPLTGDLTGLLALLLVLVGAAALLRRRQFAEGLFSASVVLFPLSTGTVTSMARYALGAFPALVLLGSSVKNRLLLYALWALELGLALYFAQRFGRHWYVG